MQKRGLEPRLICVEWLASKRHNAAPLNETGRRSRGEKNHVAGNHVSNKHSLHQTVPAHGSTRHGSVTACVIPPGQRDAQYIKHDEHTEGQTDTAG